MAIRIPDYELIGNRYGRMTVLSILPKRTPSKKRQLLCQCDCGAHKACVISDLRNGHTRSCGCLHIEEGRKKMAKYRHLGVAMKPRLTHGLTKSPEFYVWRTMKARCLNKRSASYRGYGQRGIVICERWLATFQNFYQDMGPRPTPKHSLGRIDNDGPYSPDNCRWETIREQSTNRRTNVFISFNGKELCESEWCARIGIVRGSISQRLKKGWTIADAVTTPSLPRKERFNRRRHHL